MHYSLPATWMLILLVLSGSLAPLSAGGFAEENRSAWQYKVAGKEGWFAKGKGKQWLETTVEGTQYRFEELAQNPKYVELFDRSRTMWVRMYAERSEWRQGENGRWNGLYDGRWVKLADLPVPVVRDYRIRLAYFVPTDRQPTPDYAKKIRVVMQLVAEVYRQDFEGRGIASEGLRFESQGREPKVHLIRGRHPAAFYNNTPNYDGNHQWTHILAEIPESVGAPTRNVMVVFTETYDDGPAKFEWPGGVALGGRFSTEGGVGLFSSWILRPEFCATTVAEQKKLIFDTTPIVGRVALGHGRMNSPRFEFIEDGFGAVAHELGHALGLPHDNRDDHVDIMGNGFRNLRWNFVPKPDAKRRARFSDDNARVLYTSRYLGSDLVRADLVPPSVQLAWGAPLQAGAETVRVSVTASDNEDLRAALFFAPAQDSVVGGRALTGKSQSFKQTLQVRALQAGAYRLEAWIADAGGNLTRAELKGTVK